MSPRPDAVGDQAATLLGLDRWTQAGWVALAAGGAVALVVPGVATGPARWVPLALSLVLLGLPHGAVDHHVADRLAPVGPDAARRRRARVAAAYAAAAVAGLGGWLLSPPAAAVAFLVVSAAHWGQGEGWWAQRVGGRAPFSGGLGAAIWASARGAIPILGAVVAHPGEAQGVARAITARFGGGRVPDLASGTRVAGAAALGALVLAAAAIAVRDHRRAGGASAWARDLAELAGLCAFFDAVPAAWAIGLYFLAWHAPRHVGRLVAARPDQARLVAEGRHLAALAAYHREALPCTAAALAGLALLAGLGAATGSADALAGATLGLIAALTYPHVAVVAWMDHRQSVW